jgi:hypothetical protein
VAENFFEHVPNATLLREGPNFFSADRPQSARAGPRLVVMRHKT